MRELDVLFERLARSTFRRRFGLGDKERSYLELRTLPVVLGHARDFVEKRLASADPPRDGRQTPMRGHPVFIAQHATATCCRSCLAKWHDIPRGRPLTQAEQAYVVAVIGKWLEAQLP
jgi:hypothetical protein